MNYTMKYGVTEEFMQEMFNLLTAKTHQTAAFTFTFDKPLLTPNDISGKMELNHVQQDVYSLKFFFDVTFEEILDFIKRSNTVKVYKDNLGVVTLTI